LSRSVFFEHPLILLPDGIDQWKGKNQDRLFTWLFRAGSAKQK
jgi:uncharacterized protein